MLASEIMRGDREGEKDKERTNLFQGNGKWSVISFCAPLKDSTSNRRLSGIKQFTQMCSDDFYNFSRKSVCGTG